jgi:hypothetical protein
MADGSPKGRTFAILVEYESLPDGVDFDEIVLPFKAALHANTGVAAPSLVTAFADDAAEAMIRARQGDEP